ncbi:MAG TPA: DUF72 domain-containing protein [Solirubrobacterales bacterium]
MRPVHVGCSGWVYPHWRERFYPKGIPQRAWLSFYAEHFDTVEINNTFYRLPKPAAVEGWADHSSPEFTFAIKVSRYMTHIKRLTMVETGLKRFYEPLEPLTRSGKLGPLLWQFPENFHRDEERLAGALAALPPGRHAFEFRHQSWFTDDVYALLRDHGAALVVGDESSRWVSTPHVRTADWTYIRFHHGSRGRHGNYSASEIERWAGRISQWRRDTEVYAYFNNDWEGYAIRNAKLLKKQLGV